MDPTVKGKQSVIARTSRPTRRTKRNSSTVSKVVTAKPAIALEPRIIPQRVFLYMQLMNIVNLPVVAYPLELHLYHVKETLQKMSEHYTTETIIYQHEFNLQRPAFAMGIIQDSIEDMNTFSDNPLVVALYQRIPRHRVGELKTVSGVRTAASAWGIMPERYSELTDPQSERPSERKSHIIDMAAAAGDMRVKYKAKSKDKYIDRDTEKDKGEDKVEYKGKDKVKDKGIDKEKDKGEDKSEDKGKEKSKDKVEGKNKDKGEDKIKTKLKEKSKDKGELKNKDKGEDKFKDKGKDKDQNKDDGEGKDKDKATEKSMDDNEYSGEFGEEDDYVEERLEFLSRGHCDLLQLFQRKRFISNIPIMLYPEYDLKLQTHTSQKITPTSEWHMYSILPILKNFHFTNLAFITLESIYNAPEDLHNRAGHLGISLSIRATQPNLDQEYLTLPLCTFYGFGSQTISAQNTVIVWENMKRDLLRNSRFGVSNNQMETNSRIKLPRLFRRLLKTQDVDFKLNEIDPVLDSALINNSLHRYVLTTEMRLILESAVVHNDYEILLQMYDEIPANIMYEGIINPSVFGYPEVNFCRFASVLSPVTRKTNRKTYRATETVLPDLPMFAILRICFFQTLTKRNEPLDAYNENQLKTAKLRRCLNVEMINEGDECRDVLRELYRAFDDLIKEIIAFIVKNDVTSIEEKRNYFCCNLGNLRNLLVDICGIDFNVRMPTTTNIEFREMLTHMYKDLMERIENLLIDCSWENVANCVINNEGDQVRTRRLLEEYRNMCFVGECVLAKQMFVELKAGCSNKLLFNFYVFLIAVESLNFEQASQYLLTKRESNWHGDYFVAILKLYVDYKLQLKTEETPGEAFGILLEQLRHFAGKNNLDREVWILLYSYYNQNNYLPGKEYTRWKYDNLFEVPAQSMPQTPRPLFEYILPLNFELSGKNMHGPKFLEVFQTFANLGAYGFAEVVFTEIAGEFTPIEAYLIKTTLKMLQGEIDKKFQVRKMPTDNSKRGKLMRYYQAHVNGNVEYSRRRYDDAIKSYRDLLTINITETELISIFNVSLLRLALLSFDQGNYELSRQAYELCVPVSRSEKNFLANYGMGLSLYYLNRLEDAIEYLGRSTEVDVFMPDPWGYLALINLRLGRNKTALNCWKIAKMYPEMPLNNRIYTELEKIKYSDVCLLVEDDCKPK